MKLPILASWIQSLPSDVLSEPTHFLQQIHPHTLLKGIQHSPLPRSAFLVLRMPNSTHNIMQEASAKKPPKDLPIRDACQEMKLLNSANRGKNNHGVSPTPSTFC